MKLSEVAPDLCLDAVITCLLLLSTQRQAGVLAAGPLEDLIADHSEHGIDRIETLARRSPRFRYLLTGVWSQGKDKSPVWQRVVAAKGAGRHIGDDGPLPPIDDWLTAASPGSP